jgi:nicotinamide riboside kinase
MICDTNAFVTAVFCEAFTGEPSPRVEELAVNRTYDLFLLCDPDTPFVQDTTTGLRHDGEHRTWMHERYVEHVAVSGTPWLLVTGPPAQRVEMAAERMDAMIPHGEHRASTRY